MRHSTLLFAQHTYKSLQLLLPQPYKLFHKSLLNLSQNTTSTPATSWNESLKGFDLFLKVSGLKAAHLQKLWDRLAGDQKEVFLNPPPEVHEQWVRIAQGYKEYEKVQVERETANPFYHIPLYPWEIIKDKLRHKPMFSSDVYDQLIQEAMAPSMKLLQPAKIYENFCINFEPENPHQQFEDLPSSQITRYKIEAERKLAYAKRIMAYRKAKKALRHSNTFINDYTRELGESLTGQEKKDFIQQQWEFEQLLDMLSNQRTVFKEINLEIHLSMVMDYIFEYNEVYDCGVGWRQWRQHACGNYHYLDRILFPVVVNATEEKIQLLDSLPSPPGWLGPMR
ncbi:hypothetical protein METBIDRAFT_13920 [Metschnikowia bicuspidata var. bicuspidata NRRL YB-4993]|uniref:Uncharacterized protein n=1 Tax=Metschnikowia bicuspidata var. bicuspidata NRRL YB-4993 TaxID=869754 RepID=A0A1A0H1V3_9ASCO|nr:hypothetical protein METBIDRAFT_13920 [Metschnikowia bicuspidata var. bicuspidata NRRL YB-4993]OBA18009.1 hypothetical protein METBIDRAFT_13920 [Metschnikowia bicuspidata var. bicuspidata NRRL YB-4993]